MGVLRYRDFAGLALMAALLPGMGHTQVSARDATGWQIGPFSRAAKAEPILRKDPAASFLDPILGKPVHWEALHTFNPAAVVRDGRIFVLYRAEDDSGSRSIGGHVSRLGLASSTDGIHFDRMPEPVFYPANDAELSRESPGGVEDPRLVQAPDGTYVLTYTQWSRTRDSYSVGIATSPDLLHWTKHGPAFASALGGRYDNLKYKSAGIVTQRKGDHLVAAKIDGHFWMYWGEIRVGIATSDDLIHWTPREDAPGRTTVLLEARPGMADSAFPETGPPPLLTPAGIVMLYNAKNAEPEAATESSTPSSTTSSGGAITPARKTGGDPRLQPGTYTVEEALFSPSAPANLVGRTNTPVFQPELPFERSGQYAAGTTFAEGLVLFHGQWFMYYGCADSFVGAATAPAS